MASNGPHLEKTLSLPPIPGISSWEKNLSLPPIPVLNRTVLLRPLLEKWAIMDGRGKLGQV